jgi:hypothetical protein
VSGFERVDDVAEAALTALSDQVADELESAGIPVQRGGQGGSGVAMEVDTGADEAGGVFLTWGRSRLSLLAAAAVRDGRLDDPVIRRSGEVARVMGDAVATILRSAGFDIEDAPDDMRPLSLRVVSAPGARR